MQRKLILGLIAVLPLVGCQRVERVQTSEQTDAVAAAPATEQATVVLTSDWDARLDQTQLEQGRLDPSWSQVAQLDTTGAGKMGPNPEKWEDISPQTVNSDPMHLPLGGDVAGPSVLRAQILLDRALFSPGIIDGHWGKNTEKALYWLQQREGLPRTGRIDQATFDRLTQLAAGSPELIRSYTLTAEDVKGPFISTPDDIYEKAQQECMCYESLTEKLGEMFHTSPEMLTKLNPDVDLNSATAGTVLQVPSVREPNAGQGAQVAKLVVSGEGFFVHAVDASGRILFHFPSTLGASYDPSPAGNHKVVRISRDPSWHYQPKLLAKVDDSEEEAMIPPGPNNAVGLVWMALSAPHYGIHGTAAPETIGYTTSAGCVRLTNWDAVFLADRIHEGIPVEFTGTRGEEREATTG